MPVTAATRELAVTYNGTTVYPHGFTAQEFSKDRASFTFDVVVTATSEAAFAAACIAIEAAYSAPFKDLRVVLGSTDLINVTQSGSTALDAVATISVLGAAPDSGRSRVYRVRIEYGRPASWAATSGLRDSVVSLAYDPQGRALVTLSGTFTAITSSDAKAVHDGAIATWAAAQLSWLGIATYQLIGRPTLDVSVNRKTAAFSRVYQELIAAQAVAGTVLRQALTVTRDRRGSDYVSQTSGSKGGAIGGSSASHNSGNIGDGPGDYPAPPASATSEDVVPLTSVTATYEAWVDKTVTTDLKTLWDTIEDWVIAQIADLLGTGSFGMLSAAPKYEPDENKITAVVSGVVADTDGTGLISNDFEQTYHVQPGYDFLPVWDGDPLSAIVVPGQEVTLRTTTRRWRVAGSGGASVGGFPAGGPANAAARSVLGAADAPGGSAGAWYPVSNTGTADAPMSRTVGIGRRPFVVPVTEYWYATVERLAKAV